MKKARTRTAVSGSMLRGQLMIEFFLYTAVFMFIVISGYFLVSYIQGSEISNREYALTKEVSEGFKNAVTLAVRIGEGFSYNITFQKNFLSRPYYLEFDTASNLLKFTWEGTYGNISYTHNIPKYEYEFGPAACIDYKSTAKGNRYEIKSDKCKNSLNLYNDGKKLVITQQS